jgi:hypothetical protein
MQILSTHNFVKTFKSLLNKWKDLKTLKDVVKKINY